ncbi:MAG TPA: hypothetical protein VG889_07650 [Rhizomicrobium sp.]|nr:hypothetical protein [Rhizomicrobium sp.]
MKFRRLAVTAKAVAAIPHLAAFLPEAERVVFERMPGRDTDAVAGWANKPSSQTAQAIARRRGIPYVALEDGFLRSVSLGQAGAPPLSLVADTRGIYFDATRPSDLEAMIESGAGDVAQARAAIVLKNTLRLSKYNAAPPLDLGVKSRRRVLVIDQTAGDASIAGALADGASFARMLDAALGEDAEVIVKTHPATAAGHRRGCLSDTRGARVIGEACDPIALLEQVDAVYTVSSLTGFEALLTGLPVHCFGLPFYAGWGATIDTLTSARRTATRTPEEIFAAAYLNYTRYVDPLTGKACSIFEAMERLALFKERASIVRGPFACHGFAPWKHAPVRDLLGAAGAEVRFSGNRGRKVIWASRETEATFDEPLLRMEDGFLRSVGLGSDFFPASAFVLDDLGIYYDARRPSRLETILQTGTFDTARAARLREKIVAAGLTKYNVGSAALPVQGTHVLVVGQVEDDASIRHGCADIATNAALLEAVRAARPDAFILYKEHPDVAAGNRRGKLPAEAAKLADRIVADASIVSCIDAADEIHTMTSLAGFEALLRGKPVFTHGRPFYAGWGLTVDRLDFPRRTRRLALDQLVAGTLILYALHIDPVTRLPCSPEFLVERLAGQHAPKPPPRGVLHSAWRYARAVRESLLARPKARI